MGYWDIELRNFRSNTKIDCRMWQSARRHLKLEFIIK